jgi:hypothetical protein
LQEAFEGAQGGVRVSFNVDEQLELAAAGIDVPVIAVHGLDDGADVERFQGTIRARLVAGVRREQLPVDEVYVHLDGAEAVGARGVEGGRLEVVVMRMRVFVRAVDALARGLEGDERPEESK